MQDSYKPQAITSSFKLNPKLSEHLVKGVSGFTMIELVTVIVIIGILAAVALPRFANLSDKANIAANQGFAGMVRSSLNVLHAAWIAAGAPNADSNILNVDGQAPAVNNNGWPSGGYGISNLSIGSGSCVTVINGTWDLINSPQAVTSAGNCTDTPCYVASAATGGVCTFSLYNGKKATTHGFTYNYVTGAIVVY